jgi:beta-mannosidase
LNVERIGEKSWTYKTSIQRPTTSPDSKIALVFEGLDTFAKVKLNGKTILQSSNMFLSHRVDVTDEFSASQDNILEIDFASTLLCGRELEKQHSEHEFIAHNGEKGRLGVRKAQYHWGWDWGPVLMTAGPSRPVKLEVDEGRVSDLWTEIRSIKA